MSFVLEELERTKKRLSYYNQLKGKYVQTPTVLKSGKKSSNAQSYLTTLEKWIDIYSERLKKLERQAVKLGVAGRSPTHSP